MSTKTSATKTTWSRALQHPQAQIKPLDAPTLHEAGACRVYENGLATARLKRCGQRCWGVYPIDAMIPAAFGASALEAVTTWMAARGGAAA